MRNILKCLLGMALVVTLLPIGSGALDPAAAFADTATSANGEKTTEVEGELVEKKGVTTYKLDNGGTLKKKFVTIGKKTYFFDAKGVMATGWTKIGDDYYYFDRATGVQKKNTTVDVIKLNKEGAAKQNKYNVDKIKTMMKARQIMLANTKYTDSKADKRLKMFRWVMKGNYRQYRTMKSTGHKKGFELLYANDMFKNTKLRWGCCNSNACAFAYLAKECGYTNVLICDDSEHGFVKIDGRYYDTLFAEVYGFNNYYNASHKSAWRDGVVNTLKI